MPVNGFCMTAVEEGHIPRSWRVRDCGLECVDWWLALVNHVKPRCAADSDKQFLLNDIHTTLSHGKPRPQMYMTN